jgi:hypothetical protein
MMILQELSIMAAVVVSARRKDRLEQITASYRTFLLWSGGYSCNHSSMNMCIECAVTILLTTEGSR